MGTSPWILYGSVLALARTSTSSISWLRYTLPLETPSGKVLELESGCLLEPELRGITVSLLFITIIYFYLSLENWNISLELTNIMTNASEKNKFLNKQIFPEYQIMNTNQNHVLNRICVQYRNSFFITTGAKAIGTAWTIAPSEGEESIWGGKTLTKGNCTLFNELTIVKLSMTMRVFIMHDFM